jgi:hypothetical protein
LLVKNDSMLVSRTANQRTELRQIPTNNDIAHVPFSHLRQITTFQFHSRSTFTFQIQIKNFKVFYPFIFEFFKFQLTQTTRIRPGFDATS